MSTIVGERTTVASVDEALRNAIDAANRLEREGRHDYAAEAWGYVDSLLEKRSAVACA